MKLDTWFRFILLIRLLFYCYPEAKVINVNSEVHKTKSGGLEMNGFGLKHPV